MAVDVQVLEEHGLGPGGPVVSPEGSAVVFPEGILHKIIQGYTREAGVRGLERCLATICRHCAYEIVKDQEEKSGVPFQSWSQQASYFTGVISTLVQYSTPLVSLRRPEMVINRLTSCFEVSGSNTGTSFSHGDTVLCDDALWQETAPSSDVLALCARILHHEQYLSLVFHSIPIPSSVLRYSP